MAVEHQTEAEFFGGAVDQLLQMRVVRVIDVLDPFFGFVVVKQPVVNVFAARGNAVKQSESDPAAFVADHHFLFGVVIKHCRVDFDRVPVDVDEGPADVERHHRNAEVGGFHYQFVDKGVFVAA